MLLCLKNKPVVQTKNCCILDNTLLFFITEMLCLKFAYLVFNVP